MRSVWLNGSSQRRKGAPERVLETEGKQELIYAVKVLRRDGRHAEILETVQKLLDEHDVAKHEFPEIALQNPTTAAATKRGFSHQPAVHTGTSWSRRTPTEAKNSSMRISKLQKRMINE